MKSQDNVLVKRVAFGCLAAAVILAALIFFAAKAGYLTVVQSLSSGYGQN